LNPFVSLLLLASVTLASCGSAIPAPTQAHLSVAREREPEVTLDDLTRGRSLYVSRCAGCHALQQPSAQPADRWAPIVEEMRTVHGAKIADPEARDIVRYLETASRVRG